MAYVLSWVRVLAERSDANPRALSLNIVDSVLSSIQQSSANPFASAPPTAAMPQLLSVVSDLIITRCAPTVLSHDTELLKLYRRTLDVAASDMGIAALCSANRLTSHRTKDSNTPASIAAAVQPSACELAGLDSFDDVCRLVSLYEGEARDDAVRLCDLVNSLLDDEDR